MAADIWNGTGNWLSNLSDWSLDAAPTASEDTVIETGTDTLTGAGVAAVITVDSNATFDMSNAKTLTASGLTNFGQVNFATGGGDGGEAINITGTLVNYGGFVLGNSVLSKSTTVTVGALQNHFNPGNGEGSITLWGNEALGTTDQATLDVKSAAPTILNGSVYLHGDADLEFASGGIVSIASGVELQIDGKQSRLSIGASAANSALNDLASNYGTFDEEGDWVTGPGGATVETTVAFINNGAFDLDVYSADGASTFTATGSFTNYGNVEIGNGALSANSLLTVGSLVNDGEIFVDSQNIAGEPQAELKVNSAASAAIGYLRVAGNSLIDFSSGAITSIALGSEIELDGGTASIAIGAGGSNSALKTLAANAGTLLLRGDDGFGSGVVLTTTTGFTNTGDAYVDYYGGDGGSSFTIGGALVNRATFTIGSAALSAATTVKATSLTNTGSLTIQGNSTIGDSAAALVISGASPASVTNAIRVGGNAKLSFGSGAGFTTVAKTGSLELDGAQANIVIGSGAQNSGLVKLVSNSGTLLLRGNSGFGAGGASLTTTGGFTNAGATEVDYYGYDGGSSFTIGGALVNQTNATFTIGNTSLSAATTVKATSLTNAGSLTVQGNFTAGDSAATLAISGAAPASVTNTIRIGGDATLSFGSGAGFTSVASGGSLELDGAQANIVIGAGARNSGLANLASNAGTLLLRGNSGFAPGGVTLTTKTGFTNTGATEVDYFGYDGASSFTIGGALVNQTNATFTIGNTSLSAATTVKATSLTNAGSLTIQGNSTPTDSVATLAISGAAPAVVTNTIRIGGDATLSFGSGAGFTTVAKTGSLELDSAQANIVIGAGARNSGLAGLVSNAGLLLLRGNSGFGSGGVTLTTKAGFTNIGTTEIDYYGYDGASSFTIGGALVNRGTFDLGNTSLSAASSVTATGLTNLSGQINIIGATDLATMSIKGAAVNDASIAIGAGGVLTTTGAYTQNEGNTVVDGTLSSVGFVLDGGAATIDGKLSSASLTDNGAIATFDSALTAASATKTLTMSDAGELIFDAAVSASQTVDFADVGDYLQLGAVGSFAGIIKGFADGDTIDLANTAATSFTFSGDVVHLLNGSTQIGTLSFSGSYTASSFTLVSDGHGGTEILDPPTHKS